MISKIDAEWNFWAKVNKDGPNGCWLWTGYVSKDGYGFFRYPPLRIYFAHRMAWYLVKNQVIRTRGLELDHLCRVRHCVNPDHLEVVTHRENIMRGETLPAIGNRKTHCPAGHPYEGENLYLNPRGYRRCVACRIRHQQEFHDRNGGAAAYARRVRLRRKQASDQHLSLSRGSTS